MKTITTGVLKERLDSGPVALFDVRGDVEYELGHIPGAKTAPLGSLTFRVASIMKPDSFVAVYALNRESTIAAEAVERLENLGLRNVHCYQEGLEGWLAAGLAVVESPNAKVQARGPVIECRPIVVDVERAYGGVFKTAQTSVEGAGG